MKKTKILVRRVNFVILATFIFLVGFFYFKEANAATMAGSSFTADNYNLSAAGVRYTAVFTLNSALSSTAPDNILVGTAGLVGGASVGASFCDATFGSISVASNPAGGSFNNSLTIRQAANGRCDDVTITIASGTISAGAVVTLVINNVTNPGSEG